MTIAPTPVAHHHRIRVNPWLVAVVVLSAALVAAVVWAVTERHTAATVTPTTTTMTQPTLSSGEATKLLKDRQAAMNAADNTTLAAFYALNATLDDRASSTTLTGSETIAAQITGYVSGGMRVHLAGRPVVIGRYVVAPIRFSVRGQPGHGIGANILELNANGQIVHEWMSDIVD